MKTNVIEVNHKEENSFYKCHLCQQNIDEYGIEKHFTTFHKFRSSTTESEYVCEFWRIQLTICEFCTEYFVQFTTYAKFAFCEFSVYSIVTTEYGNFFQEKFETWARVCWLVELKSWLKASWELRRALSPP